MTLKTRSYLLELLAVGLLLFFHGQALAASGEGAYRITDVRFEQRADDFFLAIQGDSSPTYTMYELFEPLRIVLDIADATLADTVVMPEAPTGGPVTQVRVSQLTDQDPKITRLELLLKNDSSYSVERDANNILVRFATDESSDEPESAEGVVSLIEEDDQASDDNGSEELAETSRPAKKKAPGAPNNNPFSGYGAELISVDFFKIDLHNVFRLIGDISGLNIVVDEGVKGSLTLALHDVPWDFVLDVVLNLKDLQKVERFNTVLILPKDKALEWPERAVDKLDFKADEKMVVEESGAKQEGLTVKARLSVPKTEVEAKKLIRQANTKMEAKDYEAALKLYEQAAGLWPENSQLANQVSSLCLVNLGMNAKAVHYAKQALRNTSDDTRAALHAAIGLANMDQKADAQRYFEQAIAGDRPSRAALLSYAAFQEQSGDESGAVKTLLIYAEVHGDTIETMVSRARIFDKIGESAKAVEQYRTILLSGYALPVDLKRYVEGRVAAAR